MEKITRFSMAEGFLRLLSTVLASAAAVIVGLDAETKKVLFVERTARIKMLPAVWISVVVASVAAAYQFLQLCRYFILAWLGKSSCKEDKVFAWTIFLLDQGMTYAIFTTNLAAVQGAVVALTGVKDLQWVKLCNVYTKFCVQAAAGLFFGLLASIVMAIVSSLSAYRVFRLHPPAPKSCIRVARWSSF